MMMKKAIILFVILLCPSFVAADVYWVSPDGSGTTCNDDVPCALSYANTNAVAGDLVYLKTGTYSTLTGLGVINPTSSGSPGSTIHFTAAPSASPVIAPVTYWAILLVGKDYIKISNIDFTGANRFFFLGNGADYNEITGCTFSTSGTDYYSLGFISQLTTAGEGGTGSTHNWIHGNVFEKYGYVINDSGCYDGGTIRIAADPTEPLGEDDSNYNTIEDNVFSYGGHDLLDLGGRYNVVRNNLFHNDEAYFQDPGGCTNSPSSGYNGNRCIIVSGYTNTDNNMIEGNRTGHAGTPPDDDGANGIENAGNNMIIRYNSSFGNGATGITLKNQSSQRPDNNRIYNNTIYSNGFGDASISVGFKEGIFMDIWDFVNVSHNGETYRCIKAHWTESNMEPGVSAGWEEYWAVGALAGARILDWTTYLGQRYDTRLRPEKNIIKNNIVFDNKAEHSITTTGGLNTYTNNLNTDPSFVNPDLTDPTSTTLPNLSLQSSSPAINGGTYLTLANGAGDNNATLHVDDALYFQDGTWGSSLSNIQADWIAIGTVTNVVQISSIDYQTNTITLAEAKTWADDAPIWLYKKSDGEVVLYGSAPDYGAHEYQDSTPTTSTSHASGSFNVR